MIYLAGPITAGHGRTVEENVTTATKILLGLTLAKIWAFSPQIIALVPGAFDIHYETWMEYDFHALELCEAVLMLPNWEESSGAKREHELALKLGKKIYYDISELL